jgi:hypothetical protein
MKAQELLRFVALQTGKGVQGRDTVKEMHAICLRCAEEIGEEWKRAGEPRDHQHDPDPNLTASRIVVESTADEKSPPVGVELAWLAWSAHIHKVDERGMSLLKAAFEAGYEAGRSYVNNARNEGPECIDEN